MKVNLLMVKQKDMEEQLMMMEIIMKDNLLMINKMGLENMFFQMAMYKLVNGNRMNLMDKENFFQATDIMKENSNKIKEKEMEFTSSMKEKFIKVSGIKVIDMDLAN